MRRKLLLIISFTLLSIVPVSRAQVVGNCTLGSAEKDLDVNNVRARLFNNGALFWKGSGNVYTIPKDGDANSIFAAGIWIGGKDSNDELRFAGTTYGPFEYWPGPIDEFGNPPADCNEYDHIYKVSAQDLRELDSTGEPTEDIENWPYELGAPVTDGDGDPDNYDIEAGDRPELIGDQMIWWVMNDAGNVKEWSYTKPIGLEIQVTAFAFDRPGPIQNATFYKYRIEHKGLESLNETYLGIWTDPDLGNAADDMVGSDTTRGMGIIFNGTDNDLGFDGYGDRPPALGFDFLQGPLVPDTANYGYHEWIDPDGARYPRMKRLKLSKFIYYNSDSSPQGGPTGNSDDPYNFLRGLWRDGTPMTFGGTGYGGTTPTNYMFPGNAADRAYWSEENTDNKGSRNTPADRRFLMSVGPFDMNPGDVQEIVFGIIWSQSVDRLSSYRQLLIDDVAIQGLYNNNFEGFNLPDAPIVSADALDEQIIISWENLPSSNNYLDSYDELSGQIVELESGQDRTYTFEGYQVYEYSSPSDLDGTLLATYDVPNQIGSVAEETIDPLTGLVVSQVVAKGTDRGVQQFHIVDSLTNYSEYYYGVQAYAYNRHSSPQVIKSPVARVSILPARISNRNGGTKLLVGIGQTIESVRVQGTGTERGVRSRVVSPAAVTGDRYQVHMRDVEYAVTDTTTGAVLAFDIINASRGDTLINGDRDLRIDKDDPYRADFHFGDDILVDDGLTFDVNTSPTDFTGFYLTSNAAGPITTGAGVNGWTGAAADFQGFPVPERPNSTQQVGDGTWLWHTGDNGSRGPYSAFLRRSIRGGFGPVAPWDWEVRFTQDCYAEWRAWTDAGNGANVDQSIAWPADACYAYDRFSVSAAGGALPIVVPFELWNTGVATPEDQSDDFRIIPAGIDWDVDGFDMQFVDHSASGSDDDPESDWFYWYDPCDVDCVASSSTPGTAGYDRWKSNLLSGRSATTHGGEIMARTVLVNWDGGSIAAATDKANFLDNVINQNMPEPGTIFRAETVKPLQAGDVFVIDSEQFAPIVDDLDVAKDALATIGIVPNPYRGVSSYEVNRLQKAARFTNLPEQATIRVFSLAGTLIRQFEKNGPSTTLEWDLTNQDGILIASGMYLIHVEIPGVGEAVIKFGVIQSRVQLDLF